MAGSICWVVMRVCGGAAGDKVLLIYEDYVGDVERLLLSVSDDDADADAADGCDGDGDDNDGDCGDMG